ncbi:phytol kinase [Deinobacterium chartae]|uniref:Phytol kinase n=1 Tax=Deinobacterium chartae TaxID=521158 RepID=A0A841I387_9DEIO|nr:hypothetical protein [Deinobacterium chartae]MBB6099516.1 phytol kinase [Deinobacterium chartae]
MSPLPGIVGALLVLGGCMVGLRLLQRRYHPHPELVRKLMHLCVGATALSFPLLFHDPQPVWWICGVAIAFMLALKYVSPLRALLGGVLDSVDRFSLGDVYFLAGVAVLFTVSGGGLTFTIPMLVLTFADALAALIGVGYGRLRYPAADGVKSLEGSVAFLTVAFVSAHVPLLLSGATGRAESLVIALLIGILVMLLEAISWQGLDNLFIPLGTFVVLNGHLDRPLELLLFHLAAAVTLTALVLLLRRRLGLEGSALLGAAFVAYLCLTLGGWPWLFAPAALLAGYALLAHRSRLPGDIHALVALTSPGLFWLLLAVYGRRPELYYPFTLSFAAQLACAAALALPADPDGRVRPGPLAARVGLAWALVFVPYAVLLGAGGLVPALHGLCVTAVAALLCLALRRARRLSFELQTTLAATASLFGLAPLGA